MTILVTGATGFVGSAVTRKLLAEDQTVRALTRPGSDRRNLAGLDIEIVEGDLCDRTSLEKAAQGCEGLFHVAADYRLWVPDEEAMLATNLQGTRDVLLAAAQAGAGRMVYTSSVATLGARLDGAPADENTPSSLAAMIGPYKRSKYAAEEEVRRLVQEDGLDVVIVNPSTPIGPADIKPTPTGRMIVEAAAGRMPAYVDTGLNVVHVDDVAEGHWLAYEKGTTGERYVLGGEDMTLREILHHVADITGGTPPRFALPHNAVLLIAYMAEMWARLVTGREPFVTVDGVKMARKKMYFRSDKARRELGYRPRPARQALEDAVAWFREQEYFS